MHHRTSPITSGCPWWGDVDELLVLDGVNREHSPYLQVTTPPDVDRLAIGPQFLQPCSVAGAHSGEGKPLPVAGQHCWIAAGIGSDLQVPLRHLPAVLVATSMIISIVIPIMPVTASSERVTVTMPADLVAGIDRFESNRSRFIADAVRHELKRRRRRELLRSLEEPHHDIITTVSLGLESWRQCLPAGDDALLDPRGGVPLRWSEEQGWQEPEA